MSAYEYTCVHGYRCLGTGTKKDTYMSALADLCTYASHVLAVVVEALVCMYAYSLPTSLRPSLCVSALPGNDVFSDVIELGRGAQANLLVGVEDNLNRGSALLRRQAQEAPRDGHQKRDAGLVVCT